MQKCKCNVNKLHLDLSSDRLTGMCSEVSWLYPEAPAAGAGLVCSWRRWWWWPRCHRAWRYGPSPPSWRQLGSGSARSAPHSAPGKWTEGVGGVTVTNKPVRLLHKSVQVYQLCLLCLKMLRTILHFAVPSCGNSWCWVLLLWGNLNWLLVLFIVVVCLSDC